MDLGFGFNRNNPNGIHMSDFMALGFKDEMEKYSRTWLESKNWWKYGHPWPNVFKGHTNLALQCFVYGISTKRCDRFKLGKFESMPPLEPAKIIRALEKEEGNPAAFDELMAAARSDVR